MCDWPGLLKWSIEYQDGTIDKNLPEMDPETRKWLKAAIENVTFNEVKRMGEILNELNKKDLKTKEDEEIRL